MNRFVSLFNSQIKKENDWIYVWVSFNAIDQSKILIIFKKESEARMKGFLYVNNISKRNDRVTEVLIQALISR